LHRLTVELMFNFEMLNIWPAPVCPIPTAHRAGCGLKCSMPLYQPFSNAGLVEVLTTFFTKSVLSRYRVKVVEACGTVGGDLLALLLETGLEYLGRTADDILVNGEAASEVGDVESNDLATSTEKCQ
jgi:hypothetical protein